MTREEWLASLKPGDTVLLEQWNRTARVDVVKHRTPTGRITLVTSTTKFRADGWAIGSDWGFARMSLGQPTVEALDTINRANLLDRLRHMTWDKLPTDVLTAVWALIPKSPGNKP